MNVGFYYHTGTVVEGSHVAAPSHLALFVEELARQAGRVTFYGHSGPRAPIDDRILTPPLVQPVDLGPRRSFPRRTFLPRKTLRHFEPVRDGVDVLLVRGPSPLLPHLVRRASCPVALLLVGDYRGLKRSASFPRWRNVAIAGWVCFYTRQQSRAGKRALVLTNSPLLTGTAERAWPCVREVFTSSLTERDLAEPSELSPWESGKGAEAPVRLLFAGRIAEEKGLLEAVEALAILRQRGRNVALELVGWADDEFPDHLAEHARRFEVDDRLAFKGYRPAGPELLAAYRKADVFIMPSRAEGFPRSIAEALAVGLPVVASRVGGIPERLDDATALLIAPKSPEELADAIERLITDSALRETLVRHGQRWARSFTNERSCALILESLRDWVDGRPTNGPSDRPWDTSGGL